MSKQMTPMKRLQNNIDNLRSHIFPFFKEVTLNKADSHYNPHGGEHGWGGSSKGVESDFIAIYKSISVPISFALTYTYMGKDETEQRESKGWKFLLKMETLMMILLLQYLIL